MNEKFFQNISEQEKSQIDTCLASILEETKLMVSNLTSTSVRKDLNRLNKAVNTKAQVRLNNSNPIGTVFEMFLIDTVAKSLNRTSHEITINQKFYLRGLVYRIKMELERIYTQRLLEINEQKRVKAEQRKNAVRNFGLGLVDSVRKIRKTAAAGQAEATKNQSADVSFTEVKNRIVGEKNTDKTHDDNVEKEVKGIVISPQQDILEPDMVVPQRNKLQNPSVKEPNMAEVPRKHKPVENKGKVKRSSATVGPGVVLAKTKKLSSIQADQGPVPNVSISPAKNLEPKNTYSDDKILGRNDEVKTDLGPAVTSLTHSSISVEGETLSMTQGEKPIEERDENVRVKNLHNEVSTSNPANGEVQLHPPRKPQVLQPWNEKDLQKWNADQKEYLKKKVESKLKQTVSKTDVPNPWDEKDLRGWVADKTKERVESGPTPTKVDGSSRELSDVDFDPSTNEFYSFLRDEMGLEDDTEKSNGSDVLSGGGKDDKLKDSEVKKILPSTQEQIEKIKSEIASLDATIESLEKDKPTGFWNYFKKRRVNRQVSSLNRVKDQLVKKKTKLERGAHNTAVLDELQKSRESRKTERDTEKNNIETLGSDIKSKNGFKKIKARSDYKLEKKRSFYNEKLARQERLENLRASYKGKWGKFWHLSKEKMRSENLFSRENIGNFASRAAVFGIGAGIAGLLAPATALGIGAAMAAGAFKGAAVKYAEVKIRDRRGLSTGSSEESKKDKYGYVWSTALGALSLGAGAYFHDEISAVAHKLRELVSIPSANAAGIGKDSTKIVTSNQSKIPFPQSRPDELTPLTNSPSPKIKIINPGIADSVVTTVPESTAGTINPNTIEITQLNNTEDLFRIAFDGLEGFGSLNNDEKLKFIQNVEGNLFNPDARKEIKESVMRALNIPEGSVKWRSILREGEFMDMDLDQVIKGGNFNRTAIESLLNLKIRKNSAQTFYDLAMAAAKK